MTEEEIYETLQSIAMEVRDQANEYISTFHSAWPGEKLPYFILRLERAAINAERAEEDFALYQETKGKEPVSTEAARPVAEW
jgi:hypothetical protein